MLECRRMQKSPRSISVSDNRNSTFLAIGSLFIILLLGLYLFAKNQAGADLYLQGTGEFQLTIWQTYVVIMKLIITILAYLLTVLGLTLIAMIKKKRQLLSFGILNVLSGTACAAVILLG